MPNSILPIVTLRRATAVDLPFLMEAIIAAEKSGTDKLSYCTIFDFTEPDFRSVLAQILEEDIEGQELCVSGFVVAECDGQSAGAACGWIEGVGSRSSGLVKGNLLAHYLGGDRIGRSLERLKLIEPLIMPREPGALQIESIYVAPAFRRRGVCNAMIAHHLECARVARNPPRKSQIVVAGSNSGALQTYARCGYRITGQRSSENAMVLALLPASTRVMLELVIPS